MSRIFYSSWNNSVIEARALKCFSPSFAARGGLVDRGLGEERFLDSLFDRVKTRECPGAHMLRRLSEGADLEEVIREYALP